MVEREKVQQKIAFLEANLEKLEILRSFSIEELQQDFMKLESAKHLLQVSIEAMLDIANHLIARCRLAAPSSAVQAFVTLAENGIITQATMKKCRLMARVGGLGLDGWTTRLEASLIPDGLLGLVVNRL